MYNMGKKLEKNKKLEILVNQVKVPYILKSMQKLKYSENWAYNAYRLQC